MSVCLFSALSRRVGALQISIIIIITFILDQKNVCFREATQLAWRRYSTNIILSSVHVTAQTLSCHHYTLQYKHYLVIITLRGTFVRR